MKLGLLARSMTRRGSIALLFLAPVVGMASIVGGCNPITPGVCSSGAIETIAGNVVTIDFFATAEKGGLFTLDETLVTDSNLGGPPGPYIQLVGLTLSSLAYGFTTSSGGLGPYGCAATSSRVPGPDTLPVIVNCYNGGGVVFILGALGQIPVHMQIASSGGDGEVRLQASFTELNTETGQSRPLSVSFLVPEPATMTLEGLGLLAVILLRRRAASAFSRT